MGQRRTRLETRAGRCGGFTLFELLLALGVLVAVFALVAPSMALMLADQRLRAGAEQLQATVTKARVEAMRTGRTLMLRCETGGRQYRVVPYTQAADILEAADMAGRGANPNAIAVPNVEATQEAAQEEAELLPEDCVFAAVDVQSSERSRYAETQAATSGDVWSQPMMFYPDGSTSTAELTVAVEGTGSIAVRVRGLTGRAELSEVTP